MLQSLGLSCGAGGCGAGEFGKTCGVNIGRIAPDRGCGVGTAGWRGNGCAAGCVDGGAANREGVTGSGLGGGDGGATGGVTGGITEGAGDVCAGAGAVSCAL